MNRILTLIRHAKAVKDVTPDIERPINEVGKKEIEELKDKLLKNKIKADMIISSPSKRTTQTAEPIAKKLGTELADIVYDKTIYLGYLHDLLKIIEAVPDSVTSLVIVGHNPSLTELARFMSKQHDYELGTSDFISMELKLKSWSDIEKAQLQATKLSNIT
jgi:phosphohistidine phosphatase